MSAVADTVPSPSRRVPDRSIEELDAAISRLASRVNAVNYRLLTLVREFDDRLGWAKWSFPSCAEWLSWRCGISLSAAREKVRTAQALRGLPVISLAFREGRLSYTKVRALTRVAGSHGEDSLLRYALDATAPQVEERCRQIRNVQPDSVHDARQVWEARSLAVWRNAARGTLCVHVELPIEVGEIVMQAKRSSGPWSGNRLRTEWENDRRRAFRANRLMRWWRSPKPICMEVAPSRGRPRVRRRITIKSWCMSTEQPSMEGLDGRMLRSKR